MADWLDGLRADPLPWLLDESAPAVRHLALRQLLDRPADHPEVLDARVAAMRTDPIAAILAAQDPAGWWAKPGSGYLPKYTSTVWTGINVVTRVLGLILAALAVQYVADGLIGLDLFGAVFSTV